MRHVNASSAVRTVATHGVIGVRCAATCTFTSSASNSASCAELVSAITPRQGLERLSADGNMLG